MKPVFGYLRVSGRGQMEGDGFDRQRQTIARFCEAKGFYVIRWFQDGAVSGETDTSDRAAFTEMLSLAGDATTRIIVVERADRLARTLAVSELACESCRKAGLQVLEAASDTDLTNSDDPTRVLIRQVLGAMAEWNKNVQVKRLSDARARQRLNSGRCEGRKPFEHDPNNHNTFSAILVMRRAGKSLREICRELHRMRIRTPDGKEWWSPSSVSAAIARHDAEENRKRRGEQKQELGYLDGLPV